MRRALVVATVFALWLGVGVTALASEGDQGDGRSAA